MNTEILLAISKDLFLLDPLFHSIDPLYSNRFLVSYRSLPLRPYRTSKITTHNLGYWDIITNYFYTYSPCFLVISSCKGTIVILRNSGDYKIVTLPLLVVDLGSASIYGSANLSSASIYGSPDIEKLNVTRCYYY